MLNYAAFVRAILICASPIMVLTAPMSAMEITTPPSNVTSLIVAFDDAVTTINDTVQRVGAANTQGSVHDTGVLDDLRRLLDIIGDHVERMRDATHGSNNTNAISATRPGPAAADYNNDRKTTTTVRPSIVNHGAMSSPQNSGNSHGDPPASELQVTTDEHGFTNITCKGISVCNPVTVISEKGGRRIKLGKLEKEAEKERKKAAAKSSKKGQH